MPVVEIDKPAITATQYAVIGEIKYENVEGSGYLEMWSHFLPTEKYFTRTLGAPGSGPMAAISGTSDWRAFTLPFDRSGSTNALSKLEVNLFLPATGVVHLRGVRQVQGKDANEPKSAASPIDDLLGAIRAVLPQGWRVETTTGPGTKTITVSRDQPVLGFTDGINGPGRMPGEKPAPQQFVWIFSVMPAVSLGEHRRITAENSRIHHELDALAKELNARGIAQKFDSFAPGDDEERAAVTRYETFKKSLRELPDYYFKDLGLTLIHPGTTIFIELSDEGERAECERVEKAVFALLTSYQISSEAAPGNSDASAEGLETDKPLSPAAAAHLERATTELQRLSATLPAKVAVPAAWDGTIKYYRGISHSTDGVVVYGHAGGQPGKLQPTGVLGYHAIDLSP